MNTPSIIIILFLFFLSEMVLAAKICKIGGSSSSGSSRYNIICEGFSGHVSDSQSIKSVIISVINKQTWEETLVKKQDVPFGKGLSDVVRDMENQDLSQYPDYEYFHEKFLVLDDSVKFYQDSNMQKAGTKKNRVKFGKAGFNCAYVSSPAIVSAKDCENCKERFCVAQASCWATRNGLRLEGFSTAVSCKPVGNQCPKALKCFRSKEVEVVGL